MTLAISRSLSVAAGLAVALAAGQALAHHSFEWNPLPEKTTANRTGASLAGLATEVVVSPQTLRDSIHGRAMVTPKPRRKVRRENW